MVHNVGSTLLKAPSRLKPPAFAMARCCKRRKSVPQILSTTSWRHGQKRKTYAMPCRCFNPTAQVSGCGNHSPGSFSISAREMPARQRVGHRRGSNCLRLHRPSTSWIRTLHIDDCVGKMLGRASQPADRLPASDGDTNRIVACDDCVSPISSHFSRAF